MSGAAILQMGQGEFTNTVGDALERRFGTDRFAVKQIAEIANTNIRTAENWLRRKNAPGGLHLMRLMAQVPELQAEMRRIAGMESDLDPELERELNSVMLRLLRKREGA